MQVMLGMGCDRGTSLNTLEAAVTLAINELATKELGISIEQVQGLATIDKKSDEVGLLELAKKHQWPMHFFNAEQLSEIEVPSPSEVVKKYMGTPSVSEAAAILAAKTDMKDLVLEKYKFRGDDNKNATVSIVRLA